MRSCMDVVARRTSSPVASRSCVVSGLMVSAFIGRSPRITTPLRLASCRLLFAYPLFVNPLIHWMLGFPSKIPPSAPYEVPSHAGAIELNSGHNLPENPSAKQPVPGRLRVRIHWMHPALAAGQKSWTLAPMHDANSLAFLRR